MFSTSNKETIPQGSAHKTQQGLNPISGSSASTATCGFAHHSSWMHGRTAVGQTLTKEQPQQHKDRGHHPARHTSPSKALSPSNVPAELLMESHPALQGKPAYMANAHHLASLNREHDHRYFHWQTERVKSS